MSTGITSYPNPRLRDWMPASAGIQRSNIHYRYSRAFLRMAVSLLWKCRVFERRHEPAEGGAVYICNHQSFLDPIFMSYALKRPMNYMARDSLFRNPVFRWMIQSVNAFPVKRGTADMGALKEAMRRIKDNGQVVVFAEGTRTLDGRIGPFLPGVAMLAQRAAQWVVPVVIDGAFEAWPRTQALPSPGNVVVQYAPAISQQEARRYSAEDFVNRVRAQMIEMQADMRRRVGRPPLKY